MRLTTLMLILSLTQIYAAVFSQNDRFDLQLENVTLKQLFSSVEQETSFKFVYRDSDIANTMVSINVKGVGIDEFMTQVLASTGITYRMLENNLIVILPEDMQIRIVTGKVIDAETGEPIPGVNILIEGTITGTITTITGEYSIEISDPTSVLVFSFVGYATQRETVGDRQVIDVSLAVDLAQLEEVVVIGYGSMRKSDLTGSVVRADIEAFREQPNISIMQSLQGSVPGLNVGQVNRVGQEPEFSIRGRTTISGTIDPLIVVDGIIFRGNIIDLNPNDIESIDVLKDASSAAVYGSQAANGVIIITTAKAGGIDGKPVISYSSQYSMQTPHKTFDYPDAEYFQLKTERSDYLQSRTEASGYLEPNPTYSFTARFETTEAIRAYQEGILTNWYDLVTRDNIHTQNHNLSISNKTKYNNYYLSVGYSDQVGYMVNEDYNRINARINIDNTITDWLKIGVQSFLGRSDYSGAEISPRFRYEHNPYITVYDANGEFVSYPGGQHINPFLTSGADDLNKRLNLTGNFYADINVPYVEGLNYRVNFSNSLLNQNRYRFEEYGANFRGTGYKTENYNYDWTFDNIVSYKKVLKEVHSINATLVYGIEKRSFSGTSAEASDFVNSALGYNRLQAGSSEMQFVSSAAWEEASIYQMARLFYGYNNKYLLTGTIRRDGFSGFSEKNKFGIFPSIAFAWVASQESFLRENFDWLDNLKIRVSYGANGNRTIARYQTLATVEGGFNYISANESSVYTQSISGLASSDLKWETTKGVNFGLDFGFLGNRLFGTMDYYNNNTYDLLYNVDIPGISRYEQFPDNLGRIHNHGLDLILSTVNVKKHDLSWISTIAFSRNRNELKELLGFDNDGDGKEDDLISEGLFIGEPLSSIYTYEITGDFWQVGEVYPAGYVYGSYKIKDITGEGDITPDDRSIIGYSDPSYRFSINNEICYKNWTLRLFINSVQGGNNYYLGKDDLESWSLSNSVFRRNLPKEIDFWSPDNPNATYHSLPLLQGGIAGDRWVQRSFVRLQDVSISYNFSSDLLQKLKFQKLSVYLSGKNLATWTKWPGWDPETGDPISIDGRPVMTSYTIGLNVEF